VSRSTAAEKIYGMCDCHCGCGDDLVPGEPEICFPCVRVCHGDGLEESLAPANFVRERRGPSRHLIPEQLVEPR
jgi:hypothetical protein